MKDFHTLPPGDGLFLAAILLFAAVSFLPWTHDATVAGMVVFGWLMAALMAFAPTVAVIRHLVSERGKKQSLG